MPTRAAAAYLFVSGIAALTYEVLWTRDLAYLFGGSAPAIAAVVAAFLAGLALGAHVAGRRVEPRPQLLRVYALLELLIAGTAPLVPPLVGLVDRLVLDPLWPTLVEHHLELAARFVVAFLAMLPATACMGATLPVLCAAFVGRRESDATGALIARLYGWNTLGGVAGCLLAGFVLVEHVGLWRSRLVAAAMNVAIALAAAVSARRAATSPGSSGVAVRSDPSSPSAGSSDARGERVLATPLWLLALFLSSGVSIALEIGWTRLTALCVGGTSYAFSIVLAVYLLGLGGGSLVYARVARRATAAASAGSTKRHALVWLAGSQLLLGLALLAGHRWLDALSASIGGRLYEGSSSGGAPWLRPQLALEFGAIVVLGPALLLGVAFPALADLRVVRDSEVGRGVGTTYLVSTAGGVAASLSTSFWAMPRFGLATTLLAAASVAAALGVVLLLVRASRASVATALGGLAIAATLLLSVRAHGEWDARAVYGGVGLYGPRKTLDVRHVPRFVADGPTCSVAVFESGREPHLEQSLHVNGKVDASSRGDMDTQLLLAWLPQLLQRRGDDVFVLGYGAGVTAAAAARWGASVRCAEIEPAVLAAAPWFADVAREASGAKVELVVDDGRSLLRRSTRRYDVVTTEPSNPWLAGMASLFTVEFYELCKARLNEGGVLCQWVQLYWTSVEDYESIFATLASVFPHVAIWSTSSQGGGDTLMLASESPLRLDPGALAELEAKRAWLAPAIAQSNAAAAGSIALVPQLARLVLLEGDDARAFASATSRRIRDDVPFLEFSAARHMQRDSARDVLREVWRRRSTALYAADELAARLKPADLVALDHDVVEEALRHERGDLAETLLDDLERRAPRLEDLPFLRWLAASVRGDAAAAEQRLAAIERSAPALLANVALRHVEAGELDAASSVLDRLEKGGRSTGLSEFARGRILEARGDRAGATAHYERLLHLVPDFAPARAAIQRLRESRDARDD